MHYWGGDPFAHRVDPFSDFLFFRVLPGITARNTGGTTIARGENATLLHFLEHFAVAFN